jgi:hypothetical protein
MISRRVLRVIIISDESYREDQTTNFIFSIYFFKEKKPLQIKWKYIVQPDRLQYRQYTGYTQKNGAVSTVNKKFISHLTRAKRTPSLAETVQVSYVLPAVRFACLLRGHGASFQYGVQIWTPQNGAHRKPFPAAAPSWKLSPWPCGPVAPQ